MTTQTSAAAVKKLLKTSNITVVGDGLSTSFLNPQFFPELGKAKSFIQVPQISVLDFGKYSFIVQPDERRAVVADTTGDLSANSPVPSMLRKFLRENKDLAISAIGFNFIFEVVHETSTADFLLKEYFQAEPMKRFGDTLASLGFKVTVDRGDSLRQVTVDPVWANPTTSLVTVNYHFDSPIPNFAEGLIELYGQFAGEVSGLVDSVFGR